MDGLARLFDYPFLPLELLGVVWFVFARMIRILLQSFRLAAP